MKCPGCSGQVFNSSENPNELTCSTCGRVVTETISAAINDNE